jgi:tmRNA-binding protein
MHFVDCRAKVELGLGRATNEDDKLQSLAKRDADRELERYVRRRSSGITR